MSVVDIQTSEQLAQVLASKGIKVIDIYADWCAPCRHLAPKLIGMAQKYTTVSFYKVNFETKLYDVQGLPTIEIWHDQVKVDTIVGVDVDRLTHIIEKLLTSPPPHTPQTPHILQPQKKVEKLSSGSKSAYRSLGDYNGKK